MIGRLFEVAALRRQAKGGKSRQGARMAFVDFLPQCIKKGGAVPNYESFSLVVAKANTWLRDHPTVLLKSCESTLIKTQEKNKFGLPNGIFLSEAMAYNEVFDDVSSGGPILVALRLWYIPQDVPKRKLPVPKAPQLKYLNLTPEEQHKNGGVFKPPAYESLFHLIEKYNQVRKEEPIDGTVLTIEVQRACYDEDGIDAERTYLLPKAYMIEFVRVFYVAGEPRTEEIGCADFAPDKLTSSGYDRYQNIFRRASMWIRTQTGIRVTNVQSVNCKFKKDEKEKCLDTQECVILWQHPGNTLRIVRIWYARPADPLNVPPIAYLTYRTFHPAQKARKGMIEHRVECTADLMKRASAWLNITGANILNVETLHIHLFENVRSIESEETYVSRKSYSYKYAIGLRFVFNGPYEEPPPGFLPPLPELPPDDSDCVVQ